MATIRLTHRTTRAIPSWLASAASNEIVNVPTSTPSTSSGLAPAVAGNLGNQAGIVNAWCGAWVYGGKFYIHGGGHSDYAGNETGWIDLMAESPAFDLLSERSALADCTGGSNYYADGKPSSRHTYYGMHPINDGGTPKMLRINGSIGFAQTFTGGATEVRTVDIDAQNLNTGAWETAYGAMPRITGSATPCCQHPETGDIYVWDTNGIVSMFDVSAGTSSDLVDLAGTEGFAASSLIDVVNNRIVRFFGNASVCTYWPLDGVAGDKTTPTLSGAGAAAFSALSGQNYTGVAHDTVNNIAYVYVSSATIYRVDLSDYSVTAVTTSGETLGTPTNGYNSRVKYVPELHSIVSLASWTSPVQVMRL